MRSATMPASQRDPQTTRRAFLRKSAAAVSLLVASSASMSWTQAMAADAPDKAPALAEPHAENGPAVLVDLSRCVGCNSCALACKAENHLPDPDVPPDALSNEAYTFVDVVELDNSDGTGRTRFAKRQCMHCLDPACVSACPAAAMYKSEEGPVIYRPNRCLGCRYCQVACPFEVPAFDWANPFTPKISKCWFCYDRQKLGLQPACVNACPTGALRFGRRGDLLAEAHARIASMPDRYVDHVFGEHEVGGTSMLYLSDVPFEQMGFPTGLGDMPLSTSSEKVMRSLPAVILGASVIAAGTAAVTHRSELLHKGTESSARFESDANDQEE